MNDRQHEVRCTTIGVCFGMLILGTLLFSMGYCQHKNLQREDEKEMIDHERELELVRKGYVQEVSEGQIIWVLPDEESEVTE